ncbi:PEP-CTERM sorting domain-containing protein [Horticoccus luteus]|uniref:PEP-CTERM sorting domain-containing protein n=1 Tax=Horticoccus luteus TaxID=2862869 RepID=A0A8F9XJU7_9BACT|nr:PEP-CTERM sorting domain-containing protein [Horticoccus luteus]QYM79043.1 PEP-CTERM sorting domain-containing protein [Horticoccus luteus]
MPFCRRVVCSVVLGLLTAALVSAQTTIALTGGDAGDGLALDSTRVVYAYNFNGTGPVTAQGVTFAPYSIGYNVGPYNAISDDPFNGSQASADDNAFRSILKSVAYDGGHGLQIDFSGLTADTPYRVDLLYYSGNFNSREEAIFANGDRIGFVTASQTQPQDTYFVASADNTGSLTLFVASSGPYGGTGFQDGAVANAVVLSSIPEPSTFAAIAGVVVIAFALWRRRSLAPREG